MSKANQKFLSTHKSNASMAMLFLVVGSVLTLVVGGFFAYIGLFLNASVSSVFDSALNPAKASGTFTFSGNVSDGELVNITNGAAIYRFEFNTTGNGSNTASVLTPNAIRINLSMEADMLNIRNTSVLASGNLTAAINANTSTAVLVTAVNTTNLTTLTASSTGKASNSITLDDNAVNVASSGMAGGVDGTVAWATTKNNVMTGYVIIGIMFIIVGALGCIIGLMSLVGTVGGRKR